MVAQSASEAIGNANRYTSCEQGMCLKYVRTWLEIGSGASDAIGAWNAANYKHKGDRTPAPGSPTFWSGGSAGHGHIGLAVSTSSFRGTDMPSPGRVSTQVISWVEDNWGLTYLGWTEDLNGVHIPYLKAGGGDVPLTDAEIDKIAAKVWAYGIRSSWDGTVRTAASFVGQTNYYAIMAGLFGNVPSTGASPGAPSAAKTLLDNINEIPTKPVTVGGGADPAVIADEVADEIAQRMKE